MHDELFRTSRHMDERVITARAEALGLDLPVWLSCRNGRGKAVVDTDMSEARRLGIGATPVFVAGTLNKDGTITPRAVISGARALGDFERVFEYVATLSDEVH
jgi:predicted DsbA family dithiol-disulfide isomerase